MDNFQSVLTVTGHGDAGNHLAFAIEFGQAATLIRG